MGMTPYGYCAGNPVKLVDVDGEEIYLSFDRSNKLRDSDFETWKHNNALHWKLGESPDHEDIFFIGAHGKPKCIIMQDGTEITDADGFLSYFLSEEDNLFSKNFVEEKQTVIVLVACRTGKGENSIGQQLSLDLGTLVIAPSEYVQAISPSNFQVYDDGIFSNTGGYWNVFYKGELMEQINGYDSRWFFGKFGQNAVQLKDFFEGKTAEGLLNQYELLYQRKHGKDFE